MEIRDQVTLDQTHRPWTNYTEVQQGSLLIELSASIRRRLLHAEMDAELARAYRAFAHSARMTGNALIHKHGIPFVPDAPITWSRLPMRDLDARVPEIRAWASTAVVQEQQPLPLRHTALDLSQAGHELERQLERGRTRTR